MRLVIARCIISVTSDSMLVAACPITCSFGNIQPFVGAALMCVCISNSHTDGFIPTDVVLNSMMSSNG